MSAALLLPAALGALAAMLIPLIIHIARRTESRRVAFAALRWLDPRPAPRRRIRLDERWLLAVRLLLLAMIALWLAKPVLWGVEDQDRVIAVAPGLTADKLLEDAGEHDKIVWLAPDFPAIGGSAQTPRAGLISLIRELDARLPPETQVELVVPDTLDNVDAERPRLTRRVVWRVMEEGRTSAPPLRRPPLALSVRFSQKGAEAVRYFRAASLALSEPGTRAAFDAAPLDRPIDPDARYLVWLAEGPLPEPILSWIAQGGTALLMRGARLAVEQETGVAWRDEVGEPLALSGRYGAGRVLRLTRALEPAAVPQLFEPGFPDALANMLSPASPPVRVAAANHSPLLGLSAYEIPPLDLRPWLGLLIAILFGLERWLATRRSRTGAP